MRPPELLPPGPDDRYEAAAGGADSTPAVVGDRSRGDAHAQTGRRPAGGQQPRSRQWPDLNSGRADGWRSIGTINEGVRPQRERAHPAIEESRKSLPFFWAPASRALCILSGRSFSPVRKSFRWVAPAHPRAAQECAEVFCAKVLDDDPEKFGRDPPAEDVDKSSFTAFSREAMAMNRSGLSRRSKKAKSCRIPSLPGSDAWVAVRGPCPKL